MSSVKSASDLHLYFDGAISGGNPGGVTGWGYHIRYFYDNTLLHESCGSVGRGEKMSNNIAEYAALYHALHYLFVSLQPIGKLICYGDSQIVINQMKGKYAATKGLYLEWYQRTKELRDQMRAVGWVIEFDWIPREDNSYADRLSKAGVTKYRPEFDLKGMV